MLTAVQRLLLIRPVSAVIVKVTHPRLGDAVPIVTAVFVGGTSLVTCRGGSSTSKVYSTSKVATQERDRLRGREEERERETGGEKGEGDKDRHTHTPHTHTQGK